MTAYIKRGDDLQIIDNVVSIGIHETYTFIDFKKESDKEFHTMTVDHKEGTYISIS